MEPISPPLCESVPTSSTMIFKDDEEFLDVVTSFDSPWDDLQRGSPIYFLPRNDHSTCGLLYSITFGKVD